MLIHVVGENPHLRVALQDFGKSSEVIVGMNRAGGVAR
jgi:hypothetical protein